MYRTIKEIYDAGDAGPWELKTVLDYGIIPSEDFILKALGYNNRYIGYLIAYNIPLTKKMIKIGENKVYIYVSLIKNKKIENIYFLWYKKVNKLLYQ